jgi:hypothetical protein
LCSQAAIVEANVEALRSFLRFRVGTDVRLAFFIVPFEHGALSQYQYSIRETLRKVYSHDIVFITRTDLETIISAQDPQTVLRRLVLGQVNLVNASPFIVRGPVTDQMFFGRENELYEIAEHIATSSYVLIGGRLMGKTSLLKCLERVRLPAMGYSAFYHDCSYGGTSDDPAGEPRNNMVLEPDTLEERALGLAKHFGLDNVERPSIILLDEVDKLIVADRERGYPFFTKLRALANEGSCRFVLSGEHNLRLELLQSDSPLYNFASEILIGRLEFGAVRELVTKPMRQLEIGFAEEDEIVKQIWDFTSGHPNIIQRLCQRLIVRLHEHERRAVTLDDVDVEISSPEFIRKDFLNVFWERATTLERLISLLMVLDTSPRTLVTIHKVLLDHGIHSSLAETDAALERLVDLRNILIRTSTGYDFAVKALPEVLSRTPRITDYIALCREAYEQSRDHEPDFGNDV